MNHKQKLGYMALGAGIMAIGIIIGQWGTPDIAAQSTDLPADFDDIDAPPSNRRFNKITCRELEVVDKDGNKAIVLKSYRGNNTVMVLGKTGGLVALDTSDERNSVLIYGKEDQQQLPAVQLYHHKEGNGIVLQNRRGEKAILLKSDDNGNDVRLYDLYENLRVTLISGKNVDGIAVLDKAGNVKWGSPQ